MAKISEAAIAREKKLSQAAGFKDNGYTFADQQKAFHLFIQEVSETASQTLALGHKENCTSEYGYPERCSCGFGALVKPLQELILPEPIDPLQEVIDMVGSVPGYVTAKAFRNALAAKGLRIVDIMS